MSQLLLEGEAAKPLVNPTLAEVERALRRLRSTGPSSFASLSRDDGSYLQTAGSPGGLLLEKRDADGRQFRAFQNPPVVAFEDGTELVFSAGRIKLAASEWFQMRQVVAVFQAFALRAPEPDYLRWRDINQMLHRGA